MEIARTIGDLALAASLMFPGNVTVEAVEIGGVPPAEMNKFENLEFQEQIEEVPLIEINHGDETTHYPEVTLTLYPPEGANQAMVCYDGGCAGVDWFDIEGVMEMSGELRIYPSYPWLEYFVYARYRNSNNPQETLAFGFV